MAWIRWRETLKGQRLAYLQWRDELENVHSKALRTDNPAIAQNGDGTPEYSVSWTDMGQPGVPKPPPQGTPPGPVVGGTDGSPYGGPDPNGTDPGWEPQPFEPPPGYTPGAPPPTHG